MASSMSFLSLGSGKKVLDVWQLHHGSSISYDPMLSPKGLSNGMQRHVTCSISCYGIRDLCLRGRCYCLYWSVASSVTADPVY
jgi:hypothetical protein